MKGSRLKIRFNNIRSDENWLLYKTQRNFCTKLLKILDKKTYTDLSFQSRTKLIIKKANQKLSALTRVTPLMPDFNKKVMFNSFIKGQLIIVPYI